MAAPKQPQDHKTKAAESDATKVPYDFEGADGETYSIPAFNLTDAGITGGDIRKNRNNQEELIWRIFEALAPEDVVDAVDGLPAVKAQEVLMGWQKASGADLPK